MNNLILIEKNDVILEMIKDSLSQISIKKISNIDDLLKNFNKINPNYLILDENFDDIEPLEFCKIIREKYSLLLPILIILNFYSKIDLEKLKSLGVDYLVKPLNKEEIVEKIESRLKTPKILPTLNEKSVTEKIQVSYEEIIEKITPKIKEEVKVEISNILKQLLEVVEKKNV
ncbi:MAG: response regulator [Thermodesulfovibrio sp.]|nr:response regulator [Thermodesulfovibrio sp.]